MNGFINRGKAEKKKRCDHDWEKIPHNLNDEDVAVLKSWSDDPFSPFTQGHIGSPDFCIISRDSICLKCGEVSRSFSDCLRKEVDAIKEKQARRKQALDLLEKVESKTTEGKGETV